MADISQPKPIIMKAIFQPIPLLNIKINVYKANKLIGIAIPYNTIFNFLLLSLSIYFHLINFRFFYSTRDNQCLSVLSIAIFSLVIAYIITKKAKNRVTATDTTAMNLSFRFCRQKQLWRHMASKCWRPLHQQGKFEDCRIPYGSPFFKNSKNSGDVQADSAVPAFCLLCLPLFCGLLA